MTLRRHERRGLEIFKGFHNVANYPERCGHRVTDLPIEVWSQCGRLTRRYLSQKGRLTQRCLSQHGRLTQRGVVTVQQTYQKDLSQCGRLSYTEYLVKSCSDRMKRDEVVATAERRPKFFTFNSKIEQREVEKVVKGPWIQFLFLLINETCVCLNAWGKSKCSAITYN